MTQEEFGVWLKWTCDQYRPLKRMIDTAEDKESLVLTLHGRFERFPSSAVHEATKYVLTTPGLAPSRADQFLAILERETERIVQRRHASYPTCQWGKCGLPAVFVDSVSGKGREYCSFHAFCTRTGAEPTREEFDLWYDGLESYFERCGTNGGRKMELDMGRERTWSALNGEQAWP